MAITPITKTASFDIPTTRPANITIEVEPEMNFNFTSPETPESISLKEQRFNANPTIPYERAEATLQSVGQDLMTRMPMVNLEPNFNLTVSSPVSEVIGDEGETEEGPFYEMTPKKYAFSYKEGGDMVTTVEASEDDSETQAYFDMQPKTYAFNYKESGNYAQPTFGAFTVLAQTPETETRVLEIMKPTESTFNVEDETMSFNIDVRQLEAFKAKVLVEQGIPFIYVDIDRLKNSFESFSINASKFLAANIKQPN